MRAYVIDSINLEELCSNWKDRGGYYELEDTYFDEFVNIRKDNRIISNYGYIGLLSEWDKRGIIYFK